MIETCTEIVDVDEDGYPSCQDILSDYELTIAEFYAWNPSVGADCSGMWAGKYSSIESQILASPHRSV